MNNFERFGLYVTGITLKYTIWILKKIIKFTWWSLGLVDKLFLWMERKGK